MIIISVGSVYVLYCAIKKMNKISTRVQIAHIKNLNKLISHMDVNHDRFIKEISRIFDKTSRTDNKVIDILNDLLSRTEEIVKTNAETYDVAITYEARFVETAKLFHSFIEHWLSLNKISEEK